MKGQQERRAHVLYKERFSDAHLQTTYRDRISKSRAVGTDGVRQEAFARRLASEIAVIVRKVENCEYKFTTYKSKLISKGAQNPPRVLSIPTLRDRLTLRVLNDLVSDVFADAKLLRPHVFIKRIQEALGGSQEDQAFVRIDVEDFYPSIDHPLLLRKVRQRVRKRQLVHLVQSAITTQTASIKPLGRGIPQGLSISNILAAIYLHDFDLKLTAKYTYFRYVDDILIICDSEIANSVFHELSADLNKLRLSCHKLGKSGKSQITSVATGIDYLGFHITPTIISVRESSYSRMIENLLAVFTDFKHLPERRRNEDQFVWRLNIKITGCIYNGTRFGWLFFFSQINDLRQLGRLDSFVTSQLQNRQLAHLRSRIKRFLRAYHEIRLNLRETKYIPKFDDLDINDIIRELALAEGRSEVELRTSFTEAEIRRRFVVLVERQTRSLEKDLIEAFS